MKGKIIKYDKKNINTDLIIPARYLTDSSPTHLATHCMEDLDPNFASKKQGLNATILVAGSNFGCGSSREQAPIAIKSAGIECIIAPSFARIFYRNAINIGLSILPFDEISALHTGDELEIDFKKGILKNHATNSQFSIHRTPNFIQEIISAGGLINFTRQIIMQKNKS